MITRQKAEAVVTIWLSDWNAMEETMHLLATTEQRLEIAQCRFPY